MPSAAEVIISCSAVRVGPCVLFPLSFCLGVLRTTAAASPVLPGRPGLPAEFTIERVCVELIPSYPVLPCAGIGLEAVAVLHQM